MNWLLRRGDQVALDIREQNRDRCLNRLAVKLALKEGFTPVFNTNVISEHRHGVIHTFT